MSDLQPQSKIVVSQKQLHGNCSIITEGELISVQGNQALVQLHDEQVPRTVDLASIQAADPFLGSQTERPNELPVVNRLPR